MNEWRTGSNRTVVLVVVALVAAWILYPRPRQQARQEGVTEIVYWTNPGPVAEATRPAIEEFERRNPQYRVVMGTATVADTTGDPTRFLLSVAGGVPPDLILFDRFAIVEWASRGAFTDLTPFVEGDRDRADGVHEENFFPIAWNEAVFNGGIYAIASDADTRAMFTNHDALIRAGFLYRADEPEVLAGKARAGQPRPPKSWEEMLRKRVHAQGRANSDGTVTLEEFVRRPGVNAEVAADATPDLRAAGVRQGDVISLISGQSVFRGRIATINGAGALRIDLSQEQSPGTSSIPGNVQGRVEVKIFDQDGYVPRLTRFRPSGELQDVAIVPFLGNSWLYMYAFSNDARFMSEDGTECRLDSAEIVEALEWVTDLHDAMGGADRVRALQQQAAGPGPLHPFLSGRVAMIIDVDYFLRYITEFRPDLRFGVSATPIPERRIAEGMEPVGWGGGWAHAIPSTVENKEAAWELLRWLSSFEASVIMVEAQASLSRAQGSQFFPRLHADRRLLEFLHREHVLSNPAHSAALREAYQTFIDLMPRSRHRPVTPVGNVLWSEHVRATEAAISHASTPYDALNYGRRRVQRQLDRVLNPPQGPEVPWGPLIWMYAIGVAGFIIALVARQERRRRAIGGTRRQWIEGYVCASPWLLGFVVFWSGPILFSLVISFTWYDVLSPARFVGIENFTNLLGRTHDPVAGRMVWSDPLFWTSLWNTLYMVIQVPLGMMLGLGMALLLDAKVRGIGVYRTAFYMPAIVPAVAGFILWFWIFDPSRGLLNMMLRGVGMQSPPTWLLDPLWSKPSLILMMLWGTGASMIIWLAGLKDIPTTYYEAAAVDGANPVQRFVRITIPLLTPYILFNAIMGMIAIFQIFEPAYIMTRGGPADSTLFYAYKLFNEAFRFLNMGTASAMAWILFVVVLGITLFQLWSSRRWVHYGN